jgi:predicted AAA+ superfamily ATPase
MREPKTREREVRALLKAARDLRCGNLLVLTDSIEAEEEATWHGLRGAVRLIPLWKWLLQEGSAAP